MEKNQALQRKVKGAMTYPVIVFAVGGLVTLVLLLKVVPTFEKMFADMGSALPAPTQFVVNLSYFVQGNWYIILGILGGIWYGLKAFYATPKGNLVMDAFFLKIPMLGDTIKKVALARFCRTLGTMISSGVLPFRPRQRMAVIAFVRVCTLGPSSMAKRVRPRRARHRRQGVGQRRHRERRHGRPHRDL